MSYTPPTYVDTKAQAILALASVVADEDKTALGDGSVNRASQYSFSSTGDIEQVEGAGSYIVTGDCSITVTAV